MQENAQTKLHSMTEGGSTKKLALVVRDGLLTHFDERTQFKMDPEAQTRGV